MKKGDSLDQNKGKGKRQQPKETEGDPTEECKCSSTAADDTFIIFSSYGPYLPAAAAAAAESAAAPAAPPDAAAAAAAANGLRERDTTTETPDRPRDAVS